MLWLAERAHGLAELGRFARHQPSSGRLVSRLSQGFAAAPRPLTIVLRTMLRLAAQG